jgi:hypothetical protein
MGCVPIIKVFEWSRSTPLPRSVCDGLHSAKTHVFFLNNQKNLCKLGRRASSDRNSCEICHVYVYVCLSRGMANECLQILTVSVAVCFSLIALSTAGGERRGATKNKEVVSCTACCIKTSNNGMMFT